DKLETGVQTCALPIYFKLAHNNGLIGLGTASKSIDRVIYGPQRTNISMGRNPDGASTMAFFSPANPGLTNVSGGASTSPLRITEIGRASCRDIVKLWQ